MTTLPGGISAFRNAAVICKDARELSGDDAAHERIKRSIAESRSVVDVPPVCVLGLVSTSDDPTFKFVWLIVQTTFAGSSIYWCPLAFALFFRSFFSSGVMVDRAPVLWSPDLGEVRFEISFSPADSHYSVGFACGLVHLI